MTFWNDNLEIGIKHIDEQHKSLCDKIDQSLNSCKVGTGTKEIVQIVEFLREYTLEHFNDEEALQISINYPRYEEHKALHNAFIKQLDLIIENIQKNGANLSTVSKINSMLIHWLTNHITLEDKDIARYL